MTTRYHGHTLSDKINAGQDASLRIEMGNPKFMDDLKELLKQSADSDRKQTIEAWLKGATTEEQDADIRGIFHELSTSIIDSESVQPIAYIFRCELRTVIRPEVFRNTPENKQMRQLVYNVLRTNAAFNQNLAVLSYSKDNPFPFSYLTSAAQT